MAHSKAKLETKKKDLLSKEKRFSSELLYVHPRSNISHTWYQTEQSDQMNSMSLYTRVS